MSRASRPLAGVGLLLWLGGGLIGTPLRAETMRPSLSPPSSLEPGDEAVAVSISHRHRAVQECLGLGERAVCRGRESDADTATVVRLMPAGVGKAGLRPGSEEVRVSFPHHVGPQEQTVKLAPGDWLIDWPGAPAIGRLHVTAGARPEVALVTTTGRCRPKENHCELDISRIRRISIRDGAS